MQTQAKGYFIRAVGFALTTALYVAVHYASHSGSGIYGGFLGSTCHSEYHQFYAYRLQYTKVVKTGFPHQLTLYKKQSDVLRSVKWGSRFFGL
jgi:hypothetical protein